MSDLRGLPYETQKEIWRSRIRASEDKRKVSDSSKQDDLPKNPRHKADKPGLSAAELLENFKSGPPKRGSSGAVHDAIPNISHADARTTNETDIASKTQNVTPATVEATAKHTIQNNDRGSSIQSLFVDDRRSHKSISKQVVVRQREATGPVKDRDNNIGSQVTLEHPFTEPLIIPRWLEGVDMKARPSGSRASEVYLRGIQGMVTSVFEVDETEREQIYNKIRDLLHKYEHENVNAMLIKKSRVLEVQGLPQLYKQRTSGFMFPHDIRADAEALFNKWAKQDFDGDIMRGLDYGKKDGKSRYSTSLNRNHPSQASWKFFGAGDLVNGQWWPSLLACMRDGAHGASEAGIAPSDDAQGAVSILMSGAAYPNKDMGEEIYYYGTEGRDEVQTKGTKALHASIKTGNKVRVLRSWKLPKDNYLRPEVGFRYDGLYQVKAAELLDQDKANYRFHLVRFPGQDPIRWSGIGSKPTEQDKAAYRKHKALAGMLA